MSFKILTINEVATKIKLKDIEATKKWLNKKNITIHRDAKQLYVYEIDVDTEIDKVKVKDLQKKFPDSWQDLYRKITKDFSVYEMVVHTLGIDVFSHPSTKVKPINKKEQELYKKYKT